MIYEQLDIFIGSPEELRPLLLDWKVRANMFDGIEIDEDYTAAHIKGLIEDDNSDVLVVREKDDIVGMLGIQVVNNPFNSNLIANEHLWYVLPKARSLASMRLVKMAYRWAKNKNCTHLIFNASRMAGDMHDKVCAFYELLGMKKFETSYIERI